MESLFLNFLIQKRLTKKICQKHKENKEHKTKELELNRTKAIEKINCKTNYRQVCPLALFFLYKLEN